MGVKIYAPKGMAIVEIKDETDSLAFDISRVRSGKIYSMRDQNEGSISENDNIHAIFGPNFATLELNKEPGKLYIVMSYSNIQAFLKDDDDE
jgi:hypothetical protein